MWLSKITFEDHHTFVCSDRLAGTGEWLPQKPEFGEWHNSMSSSILWLHGIGKFLCCLLCLAKYWLISSVGSRGRQD